MKRIVQYSSMELLVYALFACITWPILFRDGMFMDAIQYTAVAKNLSEGYGSFWFPQLSYCSIGGMKAFHEHPPLVFGIESLFFKVLGPGIFTERFYTAILGFLSLFLIGRIWRKVAPKEWSDFGFVAMLFWVLIIEVTWSFENNMQENTMGIFVMLSIYAYLQSDKLVGLFFGALFVLGAFLCKGLPGLFPLAFPFLWQLIYQRQSFIKSVLASGTMLLLFTGLLSLLLLLPDAKLSLETYFFERVLHRITQDPVVNSRFYILWKLLEDLSLLIVLSMLLLFYHRRKHRHTIVFSQAFWLMLALGICGVLPMMLTLVQRGFYMVPAFPFFAIAFALLLIPTIRPAIEYLQFKKKYILISAGILFLTALSLSYRDYGKVWREKEQMLLEREIGTRIPKGEIAGADAKLWDNWTFQTALMRYHGISIVKNDVSRKYYIAAPEGMSLPSDYELIYTNLKGFKLLRKR